MEPLLILSNKESQENKNLQLTFLADLQEVLSIGCAQLKVEAQETHLMQSLKVFPQVIKQWWKSWRVDLQVLGK